MVMNIVEVLSQLSKDDFLKSELNQIEYYLIHKDSSNEKVSQVSVAWHLDHSLKVINRVCYLLVCSDPNLYEYNFNVIRVFSFAFGYIPRGKGISPITVRPPNIIKIKDIVSQLIEARDRVEEIEFLEETSNFIHPVYGRLNKKQTKRLIEVHTKHHLKIVKDILKI